MEKTLDHAAQARWQHVHADYLSAHQEYMRVKLAQSAAPEQVTLPATMLAAREQLRLAQQSLAEFFHQHAARS